MSQGRGFRRGQQGNLRRNVGPGRRGVPPTECVCPQCGNRRTKARGFPCRSMRCSKCGSILMGSPISASNQ